MAGACLVFAGSYAALWTAGAAAMRKTVGALAELSGPVRIEMGSFRTKGFPFFLRGQMRDVSLRNEALFWRAPEVAVDALPIGPNRFVFTAPGAQALDLGRWGAYEVTMSGARASVARAHGAFVADAQADSITALPTRGALALSANGVLFKAAPDNAKARAIHASLFAGGFEVMRDSRVARGEKLLFDSVLMAQGEAAGLDIKQMTLTAHGGSVELTGVVTIGEDGYPSGVLQSTLKNPKGLAVFLADLGAISSDEARTAGAALALAAFATGGEIKAPIELKDGAARIAGVKIANLPKMR